MCMWCGSRDANFSKAKPRLPFGRRGFVCFSPDGEEKKRSERIALDYLSFEIAMATSPHYPKELTFFPWDEQSSYPWVDAIQLSCHRMMHVLATRA